MGLHKPVCDFSLGGPRPGACDPALKPLLLVGKGQRQEEVTIKQPDPTRDPKEPQTCPRIPSWETVATMALFTGGDSET